MLFLKLWWLWMSILEHFLLLWIEQRIWILLILFDWFSHLSINFSLKSLLHCWDLCGLLPTNPERQGHAIRLYLDHFDIIFASLWGFPRVLIENLTGLGTIHSLYLREHLVFVDLKCLFAERFPIELDLIIMEVQIKDGVNWHYYHCGALEIWHLRLVYLDGRHRFLRLLFRRKIFCFDLRTIWGWKNQWLNDLQIKILGNQELCLRRIFSKSIL